MLDFIQLTPYVAIAALLVLAATIAVVWGMQSETPQAIGFGTSKDRRKVSYRSEIGGPQRPTPARGATARA
jgi:hypothetical protein